jgi:hypothetical protein
VIAVDDDVGNRQDMTATVFDETLMAGTMDHVNDVVVTPHLKVGNGIKSPVLGP